MSASLPSPAATTVDVTPWGLVDGRPVNKYSVVNPDGATLVLSDLGAKIVSLLVPDRDGALADVVLGFDTPEEYRADTQSIGAMVGRYANRIRDGRLPVAGTEYQLVTNEGANTLHGDHEFEAVIWDAEVIKTDAVAGVRFNYVSPDGSRGFPGKLDTTITVVLTRDNAVRIDFRATSDRLTHVNLTHHGYFNLNGAKGTIHEHYVRIDAESYLVLDAEALPTGELAPLDGAAWDLRRLTRLGDRMDAIPRGGYHHNYILANRGEELEVVAEVIDPSSGRTMTVATTQPGIVFYAAMGLTEDVIGRNGQPYEPWIAFCMETQHHIDAPNNPQFPSTLLAPGETYEETVIYTFGISNDPNRID